MSLIIETSLGDLEVDLFVDKAPEISKNFLKLCKLKHYNNALFFEVQKNYLTSIKSKKATTIDAELNNGESFIPDEINETMKHNRIGLLSTSNIGQNRNNSEFFITLTSSHLQHFDEKHTIFGVVQVGKEILERFNTDIIVDSNNQPYINHRILHTLVIDDPFPDPDNLIEPDQSPEPIQKSDNDRLEFHEKERILNSTDKTEEEIIDEAKQQISKMREIKLQMIGDIPDADMKPPENVLFVCQLNAITQERDLEIIFSRFGVITRCEVVRDWKTGESLQYAFIEFETEKSCQEAYFKMKGALIDERRIHVDFSQSLQKFKNTKRQNNQGNKRNDNSFENMEFSKYYRSNNYNQGKHRMVFDQGEDDLVENKPNRPYQKNRNEYHENQQNHYNKNNRRDSISEEKPKNNQRSESREQNKQNKKDRKRSNSKDRKKNVNKDKRSSESSERKTSRSKEDRKKNKSRERKRSQSDDRNRKNKERKRSASKDKKRGSASKEKKNKDRKRSVSKDRKRSVSKDRKQKEHHHHHGNQHHRKHIERSESPSRSVFDNNKDKKKDSKRDRSRSQKKKDKKSQN